MRGWGFTGCGTFSSRLIAYRMNPIMVFVGKKYDDIYAYEGKCYDYSGYKKYYAAKLSDCR